MRSVLLLALAAVLARIVLATRRRRRFAATRLLPGVQSAAASLRTVAASPVKLTLLAGGSTLITLAYIAGLAASVQALHNHHPHLVDMENLRMQVEDVIAVSLASQRLAPREPRRDTALTAESAW